MGVRLRRVVHDRFMVVPMWDLEVGRFAEVAYNRLVDLAYFVLREMPSAACQRVYIFEVADGMVQQSRFHKLTSEVDTATKGNWATSTAIWLNTSLLYVKDIAEVDTCRFGHVITVDLVKAEINILEQINAALQLSFVSPVRDIAEIYRRYDVKHQDDSRRQLTAPVPHG